MGKKISKLLSIIGTRPELIKMAPVIKEIKKYPTDFICIVCITAQHRQMIDPILKLFNINPDYDLDIMKDNQTLEYIT
ncbi:MAG: UDP-N-acetylglucosamine 2-epimerase (non-hydrolyzing), partial [candidate division WOR-3 bacterium]